MLTPEQCLSEATFVSKQIRNQKKNREIKLLEPSQVDRQMLSEGQAMTFFSICANDSGPNWELSSAEWEKSPKVHCNYNKEENGINQKQQD